MTKKRDLKKLIRERMTKTGESYMAARRNVFNEWNATSRASARVLVQRAMEREPRLTTFGLGVDRYRTPTAVMADEFNRLRARLTSDIFLAEVETCARWLRLQKQIKTLNPHRHSYQYKHDVERWVGRVLRSQQYISNGALIAAAIGLDFDYKPTHFGSSNVRLNLSRRQLKIVEAEVPEQAGM